MLAGATQDPLVLLYTLTTSSRRRAASSCFPSGEKTSPTGALLGVRTCVSCGVRVFGPLTSYRKMNCVEAAVSVVPSVLINEFWPAHSTAKVLPSGLSCERTASPAMKLG